MHGWPVADRGVRGAHVWIDRDGGTHGAPGADGERYLYRVDGAVLRFAGHGARRCDGCGGTLDASPEDPSTPLPACPLCGRREARSGGVG